MTIYGIIKCEYDGHASEWYHDAESIEMFKLKDDRDARIEFLKSQASKIYGITWTEFDVELQ